MDDYVVMHFMGANIKIPRHEANKMRLGLLFGVIGLIISLALSIKNGSTVFLIILLSILIGYIVIGSIFFRKARKS